MVQRSCTPMQVPWFDEWGGAPDSRLPAPASRVQASLAQNAMAHAFGNRGLEPLFAQCMRSPTTLILEEKTICCNSTDSDVISFLAPNHTEATLSKTACAGLLLRKNPSSLSDAGPWVAMCKETNRMVVRGANQSPVYSEAVPERGRLTCRRLPCSRGLGIQVRTGGELSYLVKATSRRLLDRQPGRRPGCWSGVISGSRGWQHGTRAAGEEIKTVAPATNGWLVPVPVRRQPLSCFLSNTAILLASPEQCGTSCL